MRYINTLFYVLDEHWIVKYSLQLVHKILEQRIFVINIRGIPFYKGEAMEQTIL